MVLWPFLRCRQPLGCERGCVGNGCWDATLGCRWRRSLESQMDEINRCPFLGVDYSSDTVERCVGGDSP